MAHGARRERALTLILNLGCRVWLLGLFCMALVAGCGDAGGDDDAGTDLESEDGNAEDGPGDPTAEQDGEDGDSVEDPVDDDGASDVPSDDAPADEVPGDGTDVEDWVGDDGAETECECLSDEDCDTGNPCVVSVCAPVTCACRDFERADGTPCPNDVFCDGNEMCVAGLCEPPGEEACAEGATDPCVITACDEASDECDYSQAPDGTSCDDGLWCTGEDLCLSGMCVSDPPCAGPASDPCDYLECDESAHRCDETPLPEGSACLDGNLCTWYAVCRSGVCEQQTSFCDDSIPCSEDGCALEGSVCVTVTTCP